MFPHIQASKHVVMRASFRQDAVVGPEGHSMMNKIKSLPERRFKEDHSGVSVGDIATDQPWYDNMRVEIKLCRKLGL